MASGSFLAIPTVSNPQETECDLSLNHLSLLTSAEAMGCVGEDEEFNLDTLCVITDMISASSSANNEIPDASVDNTSIQALQQSMATKKGRNSPNKNAKKASQDHSSVNLQPTQSSLPVLTPAADILPATPYTPSQHANSLYDPDQQFNKVVSTRQAQAHLLSSPTPSCSSMTGMQLVEMMFVPNSSEDNG